jgi:2-polyprenyl-3-methyl-5-hydroxy-6-metoxy-1,4-benzoquinol methylase
MASALLRSEAVYSADSARQQALVWREIWQTASELYKQGSESANNGLLEQAAIVAGDDQGCRYLPLLNLRARIRLRLAQYNSAWQWVRLGLTLKPDSSSLLYTAGLLSLEQKDLDTAEQYFARSTRISRVATQAPVYLAHVHWLQGRQVEAFEEYRELFRTRTDDNLLRSRLLTAASAIKADRYMPELAADVVSYLAFENIDTSLLRPLALSLLHHHIHENNQHLTVEWLSGEPLLLSCLQSLLITDAGLEQLLGNLRFSILSSCTSTLAIPAVLLPLVTAMGYQIRLNEGAWSETARETALLQSLELLCLKLIQLGAAGGAISEQEQYQHQQAIAAVTALFLMYRPLARSSLGEALESDGVCLQDWPPALAERIRTELQELQNLQVQSDQIPSFSAVSDPVSVKVQQQYTLHPYPRWTDTGTWQVSSYPGVLRQHFPLALADWHPERQKNPLQVLVAGCGTGRHAIRLARYFTPLQVSAVDLSSSALAWGKMQAERLGSEINWQQGDLLEIDRLGLSFDVIECSGVLHHMDNPLAGLKALTQVLKPGGLIKIALYSRTARLQISQLRQQLHPLPDNDQDLRTLRGDIVRQQDLPQWQNILMSPDFYSLSTCRDLLCHEQEWVFDIAAIEPWLEQAGLQWVGMLAPEQYSGSSGTADLSPTDWAHIEQQQPDLFAGMYQFYARKIS